MGDMGGAATEPGLLGVLRHREFAALWGAEAQSQLGDQFARVALTVLVFERTGSPAVTALVYALTLLPALVGGVLLAGLADRLPRRRLMVACDLLRFAMLGVMALPGLPLPLLAALVVVVVLAGRPFAAAQTAIVPSLLSGEAFVAGTALRSVTDQTCQLVGFAAGGVVVALIGTHGTLLFDAVTFAVSAVVLTVFLGEHGVAARARQASRRRLLAVRGQVSEATRLVARSPALRALIGLGWLAALHVVPEGVAAPYAAHQGGGPEYVGLLMAALPAGCAVGTVLVLRVDPLRRPKLLGPLAVAAGIPLAACALHPPLWATVVLWFVAGVCTAYQAPTAAAFIRGVPDGRRGQVVGLVSSSMIALQGAGIVVFGLVADRWDPPVAVATAGTAAVVLGVVAARSWSLARRSGSRPLVGPDEGMHPTTFHAAR